LSRNEGESVEVMLLCFSLYTHLLSPGVGKTGDFFYSSRIITITKGKGESWLFAYYHS